MGKSQVRNLLPPPPPPPNPQPQDNQNFKLQHRNYTKTCALLPPLFVGVKLHLPPPPPSHFVAPLPLISVQSLRLNGIDLRQKDRQYPRLPPTPGAATLSLVVIFSSSAGPITLDKSCIGNIGNNHRSTIGQRECRLYNPINNQ